MNIVILDAQTLGDDIELSMFDKFGNVKIYPTTSPSELKDRIKDAEVIILNKVKLNETNLPYAEKVRLICVTATGFDNIDLDYCRKNDIAVCNVKGYSTNSVAQITFSMALSLVNHLKSYDDYVKSGKYTKSGVHNYLKPAFHEIAGMTWGIIGMGNIGKKVAEAAETFGAEVITYTRTPKSEYNCVSLDELCEKSDIISIHTPLTEETKNLINSDNIAKMKKSAVVINVARGAVVDENALAEAIINNQIGALGVDVYSIEPMSADSPYNRILDRDNVVFMPHAAWAAYEARMRCMEEIAENIEAFLRGEKRNRVD